MPVPSIKKIKELVHKPGLLPHEVAVMAKEIRAAMERAEYQSGRRVDDAMETINKVLGGYGVEAIEADKYIDSYYRHAAALFVNMGDTYDTTVLFDTDRGTFRIVSYGDLSLIHI